jgi:hypothetical protein
MFQVLGLHNKLFQYSKLTSDLQSYDAQSADGAQHRWLIFALGLSWMTQWLESFNRFFTDILVPGSGCPLGTSVLHGMGCFLSSFPWASLGFFTASDGVPRKTEPGENHVNFYDSLWESHIPSHQAGTKSHSDFLSDEEWQSPRSTYWNYCHHFLENTICHRQLTHIILSFMFLHKCHFLQKPSLSCPPPDQVRYPCCRLSEPLCRSCDCLSPPFPPHPSVSSMRQGP